MLYQPINEIRYTKAVEVCRGNKWVGAEIGGKGKRGKEKG